MVTFKNLYIPPKKMIYEKDQYPQSTYEKDGYVYYNWKNIPKYNEEIDKGLLNKTWHQYYGKTTIKFEQAENVIVTGEIFYQTNDNVQAWHDENNTIYYEGKPGSYKISFDIICDGQPYIFETSTVIAPNQDRTEYYYLNKHYLDLITEKNKFLDNLHNGWKYQA